jgi:hypothetical protein
MMRNWDAIVFWVAFLIWIALIVLLAGGWIA